MSIVRVLPAYLSLHAWNGHTQLIWTPTPPAPSINPRLGQLVATYALTDEQRTWSVHELRQAIELQLLTPYAPPVRVVPWQAARFGLGPKATRADALRVAARVWSAADARMRKLMAVAVKWWPKPIA